MKLDKRALILNSIIEAYLKENAPVSSQACEASLSEASLSIAASTIRLYFRRLIDEGELEKVHISSGRVPTARAMKQYWSKILKVDEKLVIKNAQALETAARKFEIYCLVYAGRSLILREVARLNDRFLMLDFDEQELVLKFSPQGFVFLKELIGLDIFSLENLALRVKFTELLQKLEALKQSLSLFRTNEKRAYQIYQSDEFVKLLDSSIHRHFRSFLEFTPLFSEGFMGLLLEAEFLGKPANIILAGSVYTDFKKVIHHIKEVA